MNSYIIALIAGLSGMFGLGIADFLAKKTIDKIGELKTLLWVQVIGGIILIIIFLLTQQPFPTITTSMLLGVFLLAVLDCIGYLFMYRAFHKGVMSIVSPIASSASGFSVLVTLVLFKESLTNFGIVGVTLIFVGILITSLDFSDLGGSFNIRRLRAGVPEAFVVFVLFGLWFPLWDRFVENKEWMFWLIMLKIMSALVLVIFFYISNRLKGKSEKLTVGYSLIKKTLFFVGFFEMLAYLGTTWGYSVTTNTTSFITVIANSYSIPTIALSYIFLKERISKQQMVGIVSVISGIIISSF
jgi:drug/metabolite transporter (DMT)-like permease